MSAEDFYKEYYPPKMHLFRDKTDRRLCIFNIDDMLNFAELFAELKGKELLNDVLKEKQELIAIGGLRFTGTNEEKIKQIFDKHGIKYESPF